MAQVAVQTESLFQALLESAPDAVVIVNDRGAIVLANDRTTKLFGYSRAELLGQPVEMLLPERLRGIHERHREHYGAAPHTRPMGIGLDLYARRKDGSTFPVEISLSTIPTHDGALVTSVIRDVTERQRAAQELERQVQLRTAHLNTLLQLSQELFGARSLEVVLQRALSHAMALAPEAAGGVIYLYDAAEPRLALRASTGSAPPSLSLPLGTGFVARAFSERRRRSAGPTELAEIFTDSARGYGGAMAIPLIAHDDPIGVLVLIRAADAGPFSAETSATLDGLGRLTAAAISEEQSASAAATLFSQVALLEEQQRSMADKLNTAEAGMLQAARLAAVGQLSAAVSHEINNPLYAARNCLYLLEEDLPADLRESPYLKIARDELGRIAGIIQRMRDFYRPTRGDLSPWDINRLLEETLTLARLNMRHVSIDIIFTPAADVPPVVCDGDQLRQVFLNLLLNAIDAMPAGGTLTIRTYAQGGLVIADIQDSGVGIPADIRDHLFEPFFTTKSSGTGLGLSISAHIVTQLGGRIDVESSEGQGSTFRVILPTEGAHL